MSPKQKIILSCARREAIRIQHYFSLTTELPCDLYSTIKMSGLSLQEPYVVATLPRPVDTTTGRYKCAEVHGSEPGSRKRKRELVVGVDGEGVNLYDVCNYIPKRYSIHLTHLRRLQPSSSLPTLYHHNLRSPVHPSPLNHASRKLLYKSVIHTLPQKTPP